MFKGISEGWFTGKRSERRARQANLSLLIDKIKKYDPLVVNSNFTKDINDALRWADERYKSRKIPTVNDEFSDPFLIVNRLVDDAKADRQTILATILYPSVRRALGNPVDEEGLNQINTRFGSNVCNLVKDTLRLLALERLPLEEIASLDKKEQSKRKQEQLRLFRLMGLWIARCPQAILIRGTHRFVKLIRAIDDQKSGRTELSRQQISWIVTEIREDIAPLVYIAGHGRLRSSLLDACDILEDRDGFISNRTAVIRVGNEKICQQDLLDLKEILKAHVSKTIGPLASVDVRRKRAHSAREKAERKDQTIQQLGDKIGVRIVIERDPRDGSVVDPDGLDEGQRDVLLHIFSDQCHRLYAEMSQRFGRGSPLPEIREEFAKLVKIDPHPDKAGIDGRFDNYIKHPKESGYSAIQDTIFVWVNGKKIEIEMQIVDIIRHEHNTNGRRTAHDLYKTGLVDDADIVWAWREQARVASNNDRQYSEYVYVFGPDNQIIDAGKKPLVSSLAQTLFSDSGLEVLGVRLDTDNPLPGERRDPTTWYSGREPLQNGDQILEVYFANRPAAKEQKVIADRRLRVVI